MEDFYSKSVGSNPIPNSRREAGVGYIVIPQDVDRNKFIASCIATQTVVIGTEYGEFIKDVKIDKDTIQRIDFPDSDNMRGSAVLFVNVSLHNKPAVIAVFAKGDEVSEIIQENEFNIQRINNDNVVQVNGRANDATLNVSVISGENGKGEINMRIVNPDKTAKLNLHVTGDVTLRSTDEFDVVTEKNFAVKLVDSKGDKAYVKYESGKGFTIFDEFKNQIITNTDVVSISREDGRTIEINKEGISHGKSGVSTYKHLLGEKDNEWKTEMTETIMAHTHATGMGPSSPPVNDADFANLILPNKLTGLLSTVVTLE